MKKIFIFLLLITPLIADAQFEQSGIVRKQTFDAKSIGKPITGAIITPYKGNKVESKNGEFKVVFNNKKNEDTATIISVKKQGFRLVSTQYLKKGGIVLSKAPIEIIMGDKKEQELDAQKTFNNIIEGYKLDAQKQYIIIEELLIKIDNLIKEGKENSDQYEVLITEVIKLRKENNDLKTKINDKKFLEEKKRMADSLSVIDIQGLNEINMKNIILKKEGNWKEVVRFNKSFINDTMDIEEIFPVEIEKKELELKKIKDERDFYAERFVSIAEGYKNQFNYDSAAIYYIKLAKINKTNWKYQMTCGYFFEWYKKIPDVAMQFYNFSLKLSQEQFGEISRETSKTYCTIGKFYLFNEDYDNAIEYLFKSLVIENNLGNNSTEKDYVLYLIGRVYFNKEDYSKALEYFFKSLTIIENNIDHYKNSNGLYPGILGDIGDIYYKQRNYNKALKYELKYLEIVEEEACNDINNYHFYGIDNICESIALVYYDKRKYNKALEYYFKVLKIREKLYDNDYLRLADDYKNIGSVYFDKGNYLNALEYLKKAYDSRKEMFGEEHSDTKLVLEQINKAKLKLKK